ncbi:hypothetical protein [Massilia antarctica]|uniref:hypothetical protein n=1 Tax=Massilia antarctica TaxID=2765360 RepID=UPI0006BB689C|nr:hypothetical protein [Massilia sp. H27-R4]MCY0915953.1 hypothetical protein [Massilia sp. H27-R4]CUI07258.1 hypothetical protein BN2497_9293 [Janthinobacterium sp. CG23_2]CUU31044.1 hypothetical protein BN3177_9293 [Janthinobacterium sp. CG23_2]
MRTSHLKPLLISLLAGLSLAACSPQFNWRDYSSPDAPFRVLFPDKPATHSREVDLDGMKVKMTMTAARIDGTMFAVGSGEAPDPDKAEAAVAAMKTALVRNIGATIKSEKTGKSSAAAGSATARASAIDIDASGVQKGVPMRLVGHFESRNKRFYQVIVMGKEKDIAQEQVDMFMSSFKLQ